MVGLKFSKSRKILAFNSIYQHLELANALAGLSEAKEEPS